jgi:tetratricopeptide (TPR) repeat protein
LYQKLANAYSNQRKSRAKGLFYYLAIEEIIEHNGYPEKPVMYNNMGKQYATLNDYKRALEYFRKAELQCEYINCDYIQVVYANIGIACTTPAIPKPASSTC